MRVGHWVGMTMLFVLMGLGSADVLGRYFLNRPIVSAGEINQILLAGVVFFGWADSLASDAQVKLDLLVERFGPLAQAVTDFVTCFLALGLFVIITWQSARMALNYWRSNRLVDVIMVNQGFFQAFVTLGAFLMCLELIIRMTHHAVQMRKS
jgi:TRAP-type C4-dicarboxylate transport system permease small subunit